MEKQRICRVLRAVLDDLAVNPDRPIHTPRMGVGVFEVMVEEALRTGAPLDRYRDGAWWVDTSGKYGTPTVPAVVCGRFAMLDHSPPIAANVAALLNWCGIPEPEAPPGTTLREHGEAPGHPG
ncbi:MAG TPA: hypothetical protein VNK43_10885 [Gemmatimonadales bacterium]|nr:hypothetical protein [Gemmatimonadales bacterium]